MASGRVDEAALPPSYTLTAAGRPAVPMRLADGYVVVRAAEPSQAAPLEDARGGQLMLRADLVHPSRIGGAQGEWG
jgi:hypothetical protein